MRADNDEDLPHSSDRIEYIADLAGQLRIMALAAGYLDVAYLLEIAELAAMEHMRMSVKRHELAS